jgi:hypothetical protein
MRIFASFLWPLLILAPATGCSSMPSEGGTVAPDGAAQPEAPDPAGPTEASSTAEPSAEHAQMLATIEEFFADPQHVDPKPIVDFMINSPDVMVVIGPGLRGIAVGDDVPESARSVLLAAFVAGNIASQLRHGRKKNDAEAGYTAVADVYQTLERDTGIVLPAAEELVAAKAAGDLPAWVHDREPG